MKEKQSNRIKNQWAKPKKKNFDFDLIAQYSVFLSGTNSLKLEDKTLFDLDFQDFFKFVDRTNSSIGQQILYNQIINQKLSQQQLERQETDINYFDENENHRLKAQVELSKLKKETDYYFPYLIYSILPKKFSYPLFIYFLQFMMALSLILIVVEPAFFLLTILIFAVNLFVHYMHKQRIGKYTIYFSRLSKLSSTLIKLIPVSNFKQSEKSELFSNTKEINSVTSKIIFLKTDNLQSSEIGSFFWFIFELVKILTLGEISVFNRLVDKIKQTRHEIENLYKAIGRVDVAISILSLRQGLHNYSIPKFTTATKSLNVSSLYHPLVPKCVSNSIYLNQKSLLLTGSNMAGKSTFIKAVNLNCLSAQTLNTSFSDSYEAPFYLLKTSINIKDDIDESKSYFMEEVLSIGDIISTSNRKSQLYIFTIDEIFKGTNTIERISSAKAILELLNSKDHLVLVSTHDIELTKLLKSGFDLYHFQESITDKTLSFDYKLRKGSLERSNAIDILEIAGYPKEIINEAKKLALQIQKEKTGHNIK